MIAPLSRSRAALLVIDIQERLTAAMPELVRAHVMHDTQLLINAAHRLGMPIVVSQQYPRGLGPTMAPIEDALSGVAAHRFDKVEFSAVACSAFPNVGRDQWILCGMETHVCVYQTARGLLERGHQVHVAADAVCSRTKANWKIGLGLCERAGAVVSSTETCVFDLLGHAGTEEFRFLSKAIK